MVLHDNFQDFVLFLYVHIALADTFQRASEEDVILSKMGALFPTEKDLKKKLEDTVVHYKSLVPEQISEIIRDTFKHFDQVKFAEKYKVYTDLYDVINADGKVDEAEKMALDALKEIINMNVEAKQD
jgi:uncharacterized tellurite resistance protein B-like protein